MRIVHTKKTEIKTSCPNCHMSIDAVSDEINNNPKPGDITVCLYCAEILTFNEDMQLKEITLEEWREISEEMQREIFTAKNAIEIILKNEEAKNGEKKH